MKVLSKRLATLSERAVQRRLEALAEQASRDVPGARVLRAEGAVEIEAPGMRQRWLREASLRFLARVSS